MRKSRIIFVVTMILLVACTCTVMGATYDEQGYFRKKAYTQSYTGANTIFCANGNSTQSYTTIYNSSSNSCHMDARVREYDIYSGAVLGQAYNSGTKPAGQTVNSGNLSRDYNNNMYCYEHIARCYKSSYEMNTVLDSYSYVAYQTY